MKTPLNVRWHYNFTTKKVYNNGRFVDEPIYSYRLVNGGDTLYLNDIPIKVSKLAAFIKSLPLTSDFEKPIYEDRDKNGVRNIIIVPGVRFFITLHYFTLSYNHRLDFHILKKDNDLFEFKIFKESYHTDTHERTEETESKPSFSKEEVTDMFNKLPETIDLGIFKLPFGNCFECEPVEE